jgi:hypothetical protein
MWLARFISIVALLCWEAPSAAEAQERSDSAGLHPAFWHAAAGVLALNTLTWSYNHYIQHWPWANVGTRSWWENIRGGFVWDDDVFMDNQLAHPYHGSLYFNSARASGYGFWQAAPFVAAGSIGWELFSENVRPSTNDLIITTLGGIALGEVTYRLSSLLRPNQPAARTFGRDLGAFALSPIARAHGLLRGKRSEREDMGALVPPARAWVAAGRRKAKDDIGGNSADRSFVELAFQYGSAFDERVSRPYDAFEFRLQVSPEMPGVVTHIGISGLLARKLLGETARSQSMFGLFQHYDYDNVPVFKFGGQSLSGAWLYRRQVGLRSQLDVAAHLEGLALGSISSDYGHARRRDYDYGPGAGSRLMMSVRRDGYDLIRFDGRLLWVHSMYGSKGDHLAVFTRLAASLQLSALLGLGCDLGVTTRHSWYPGVPPVTQRVPQMRAYLMWQPS